MRYWRDWIVPVVMGTIMMLLLGLVQYFNPRVQAQVPAYRGYPVLYGCLYVSAQGFMVIREVGVQPTPEQCR
jgi:hypothetical protein